MVKTALSFFLLALPVAAARIGGSVTEQEGDFRKLVNGGFGGFGLQGGTDGAATPTPAPVATGGAADSCIVCTIAGGSGKGMHRTVNGMCTEECFDGNTMALRLAVGWSCGSCSPTLAPVATPAPVATGGAADSCIVCTIAGVSGKGMHRTYNGKCTDECFGGNTMDLRLADGWSCGSCSQF
jgi:hypothetical protein